MGLVNVVSVVCQRGYYGRNSGFKEGGGQNGLVERPTDKDSDANYNEFVSSIYNTAPAK